MQGIRNGGVPGCGWLVASEEQRESSRNGEGCWVTEKLTSFRPGRSSTQAGSDTNLADST